MAPGDVKKHGCQRCGRRFARREHLQRHERSHTKEQPFACRTCSQAFTRKDLLSRHVRLNHQQEVEITHDLISPEQTDHGLDNVATGVDIASSSPENSQALFPNSLDSFLPTSQGTTRHDEDVDPFDPAIWDNISTFADNFALPFYPFSPSEQHITGLPSQLFGHSSSVAIQKQTPTEPCALSRFGSRLPSLDPEDKVIRRPRQQTNNSDFVPQLFATSLQSVKSQLEDFSSVVSTSFVLPTRHTLNRFIHGYFSGFHGHYPMFHMPTISLDEMPIELVLSVAAIGAQYCLERAAGMKLYCVARAIAVERIRRRDAAVWDPRAHRFEAAEMDLQMHICTTHTFILLVAVSMWSEKEPAFHEALSLRSTLEQLVQSLSMIKSSATPSTEDNWRVWVRNEQSTRTVIIAFCFFNLQTIVYDVPPILLVEDLKGIALACSETIWEAPTSIAWQSCRGHQGYPFDFEQAFEALFSATDTLPFTPVSSHGLIHAMIQRIWLLHRAAKFPLRNHMFMKQATGQIENALKRWKVAWEKDDETSATPLKGHGPMSFTSASLLRLAYIRINMLPGSVPRSLRSWNAVQIARDFDSIPPIYRSPRTTRAALHCAHGLSVIVKLGIEFFARTQIFFISNQYALCSLESAVFLSKWLDAILDARQLGSLSNDEAQLLEFVLQTVAETEFAIDGQDLTTNNNLGATIARLWAKLFRPDSIWEIVGLIGRSLNAYADLIDQR